MDRKVSRMADPNGSILAIDAEVGRGYWEIEIKWPESNADLTPVKATVSSFAAVVRVLVQYGDYSSATINYVPFTKPEDL